ncbi:hypothetical protein AN958_10549 [Leucoagaricus sp. SymC.cos]|nr:hypothetical protein AN958_10549 [Leucoagaricus sp. SymC.cos]
MQNKLFQVRNGVFATCLALSLSTLGLSAHWTSLSAPSDLFDFEGIGLVASCLSIITLGIFLSVGIFRKNAIITIIGIELPTLIVLSALFLAEGIILNDTISVNFPLGCNDPFRLSALGMKFCKELISLKGISFAIFAVMTAYWLPLLIMVIIELTQGRNTLTVSVRDVSVPRHTQAQANAFANGFMESAGIKDPSGDSQDDQQHQHQQQQQLQLQQLQLQQLQQQEAMLQQQYSTEQQQAKSEV